MSEVWVQTLIGENAEPFLAAALRSVAWADGYSVVNTDPEGERGQENELTVRRTVPPEKLRLDRIRMSADCFSFSEARNVSLDMVPKGAYVLIVDADEVYYPEFEERARRLIADGRDAVDSRYYHLAVYKDLLHSEPYREILYREGRGVRWEGGVHELLSHPRRRPARAEGHHCVHLGYIKPARDVAGRWERYRSLGSPVHEYDRSRPDRALDDWPRVCRPFVYDLPPEAEAVLGDWPSAPPSALPARRPGPPRVGLVLLTWDDAENLRACLRSLEYTTEPFELVVVDNGSTDDSLELVDGFRERTGTPTTVCGYGTLGRNGDRTPLPEALNFGLRQLLGREHIEYVGWVHPDMIFEWPDWLAELARGLDEHPGYVKLGATEAEHPRELHSGDSPCYVVRKRSLERVGLYDERFEGDGSHGNWELNARLVRAGGAVMVWPGAIVRHLGMGTRRKHLDAEAARRNADLYHEIVGQWSPVV